MTTKLGQTEHQKLMFLAWFVVWSFFFASSLWEKCLSLGHLMMSPRRVDCWAFFFLTVSRSSHIYRFFHNNLTKNLLTSTNSRSTSWCRFHRHRQHKQWKYTFWMHFFFSFSASLIQPGTNNKKKTTLLKRKCDQMCSIWDNLFRLKLKLQL